MLRLPDDAMSVHYALRLSMSDDAVSDVTSVSIMTATSNIVVIGADYLTTTLLTDCDTIIGIRFRDGAYHDSMNPIVARNMLLTLARRLDDCVGTSIEVTDVTDFDYLSIVE